ncbi:MAG: 16S rRNA (uracil(1498)-N(3))-methyltransferase [Actinobacteria bacterium]|nr:16S rRNA (uracil(1498)-N(3))-methyltransferase [Actinomycetota bacterium]
MSYPYFFINNENFISSNEIAIKGDDLNHLLNVLRSKKGDFVEISDNSTNRYKTEIKEINKSAAILIVKEKNPMKKQLPDIILFQCILKKGAMELVIQKSTEIGVDSIIPVFSSRVVITVDSNKMKNKLERWQTIAEQSSKQSKRNFICNILPEVKIKDIAPSHFALFFVPNEFEKCVHFKNFGSIENIISKFLNGKTRKNSGAGNDTINNSYINGNINKIAYIIGPEGGFEDNEINLLAGKGAIPVNFGKNILRSETSSIYFLSVLDYLIKKNCMNQNG